MLGALITQGPKLLRLRAKQRQKKEAANDKDLDTATALSRDLRKALDEYTHEIEQQGALSRFLKEEGPDDRLIDLTKHESISKALISYERVFTRRVDDLFFVALSELKNIKVRKETNRLKGEFLSCWFSVPQPPCERNADPEENELTKNYLEALKNVLTLDIPSVLFSYDIGVQKELIEAPQRPFWGRIKAISSWRSFKLQRDTLEINRTKNRHLTATNREQENHP